MIKDKGTYIIILSLDEEAAITVGRLGIFSFPPGYYLYVGSALGGLSARIMRHVRGANKLHWHIDYLRQEAKVVEVWYLVSGQRLECRWYRAASGMANARTLVAGFGSSGCACLSHLLYFDSKPSFEEFLQRLGEQGAKLERQMLLHG